MQPNLGGHLAGLQKVLHVLVHEFRHAKGLEHVSGMFLNITLTQIKSNPSQQGKASFGNDWFNHAE